jgi:hypothetical protein
MITALFLGTAIVLILGAGMYFAISESRNANIKAATAMNMAEPLAAEVVRLREKLAGLESTSGSRIGDLERKNETLFNMLRTVENNDRTHKAALEKNVNDLAERVKIIERQRKS